MVLIRRCFLCLSLLALLVFPTFAQNESSATTYANQAKEGFKQSKYAQSDSLYVKAESLINQDFTENSPEYISVLSDYIKLSLQFDKLTDLRPKIDMALSYLAKSKGKSSVEYTKILNYLGKYLCYTFEYAEAEQTFIEALRISKELQGEESSLYILSLIGLGEAYFHKQELAKAEESFDKASKIASKIDDKENRAKADLNMATLYGYTGRVPAALKLFPIALDMYKEQVGERDANFITPFSNYGTAYIVNGNYQQAESILIKALELADEILGEEHRQYLITLKALANVYITKGRYEQTEKLMLKAVEISKKKFGDKSPILASNLSLLSTTYMYLGDYSRAEKMMLQSIEILSESPDAFKQSKAGYYNSLGVIYMRQERYDDAMVALKIALETQKENNLLDNFLSIAIANNICSVQLELNNNDFANIEQDLLAVLEKHRKNRTATSAFLAQLTNLTALYRLTGEYEKAFRCAEEAIAGWERGLDTQNWQFINLLQHYAQTLQLAGRRTEALAVYDRCLDLMKEIATRDFLFLTEQERYKYWNAYNSNIKEYLNFVVETGDINAGFGYNCELFAKNLLLNSEIAIQNAVLKSNDESLIAQWRDMKSNNRTKEQERTILAALKKYGITNELSLDWQQVQQMLNDNEVAIEIFNAPTKIDGSGEIRYFALIVTSQSEKPILVTLCSHNEMVQALKQENKKDILQNIYQLAWTPLKSYLQKFDVIYIAPSGLFNSISYDAMHDEKGCLADRYTLHRLLSTRDIRTLKANKSQNRTEPSLVLFGGADYGVPSAPLSDAKLRGQGFDYLPGSLSEVSQIKTVADRKKWDVALFTGPNASEARMKSYSGNSPKIIHISTHGFYFPVQLSDSTSKTSGISNRFSGSQDPMMRSGLLFSGANKIWTNNAVDDERTDDGVLTASEIANLDFSNTELVVLSACDTGLGDIDYNEGIYGLQRAFRLAGVKAMIVSLWNVPDKETTLLMKEFYKNFSTGLSIKEAFTTAQQSLRKSYPNEYNKWGAFILVE